MPATGLVKDDGSPWDPNVDLLVTTDDVGNTVLFDFAFGDPLGSFDDPSAGGPYEIEIVFSLSATDQPFSDGLFLTNQALTSFGTTGNETQVSTEIVMVELTQPDLQLTKGVVASNANAEAFTTPVAPTGVTFNAPGTNGAFSGVINSDGLETSPIDADLSGVDAGDLVTFAIVVENIGQRGAFDLLINDVMPAGFQVPASGAGLNLQVANGAGNAIGFDAPGGDANALFGGGIRINDDANGAINAGVNAANDAVVANGRNIIVVTYDLQAVDLLVANSAHENTAELLEYAAVEGGNDFTDGATGPWSDNAFVTAAIPSLEKKPYW